MSGGPLIFIAGRSGAISTKPFGLRPGDRLAHMYVIGKTGTGKSSLLEAMVRQDVLAGNGLALFDPHGDLAERLNDWIPESRRSDVIYLNVPDPEQPFGFNPLQMCPPLRRSRRRKRHRRSAQKLFEDAWGCGRIILAERAPPSPGTTAGHPFGCSYGSSTKGVPQGGG